MLETYYKTRRTLVDFRRGPLGPHFDGFADYIKKSGYNNSLAMDTLSRCCAFNYFLIDQGIASSRSIHSSLIESFPEVYFPKFSSDKHQGAKSKVTRALKKLFTYLTEKKAREPKIEKPAFKPYGWMLEPYLKYLTEDRQFAKNTIERTRKELVRFLARLGKKVQPKQMKFLKAIAIEGHIKKHFQDCSTNLPNMAGVLRCFLRFCTARKYTAIDLSDLIPSVPTYRLASLPQKIDESSLRRILNAVSRTTSAGLRDYAILLVMMAYGIRGKQAAELLLEDINWERSTIRIRAMKGGKEVVLPLLEPVGEAILVYLRHRPECRLRQVFLTAKAPFNPVCSLGISCRIHIYMAKAGVKVPGGGSRSLRHSWAIRALAQNNSMKAIADVMGHRKIDTTFIYAKADLKTLQQVVMPWVGVKS